MREMVAYRNDTHLKISQYNKSVENVCMKIVGGETTVRITTERSKLTAKTLSSAESWIT